MEVLGIIILSAFALYGIFAAVWNIPGRKYGEKRDAGFRIILYAPENSAEYLEGIIRGLLNDEFPERLMTDGRLYVSIPEGDERAEKIIRDLQKTYPVEMLPQKGRYCIITDRSLPG